MAQENRYNAVRVHTYDNRQNGKELMFNLYSKVNYNPLKRVVRYTDTKGKRVKATLADVCNEIWSYDIPIKTKDIKTILLLLSKN